MIKSLISSLLIPTMLATTLPAIIPSEVSVDPSSIESLQSASKSQVVPNSDEAIVSPDNLKFYPTSYLPGVLDPSKIIKSILGDNGSVLLLSSDGYVYVRDNYDSDFKILIRPIRDKMSCSNEVLKATYSDGVFNITYLFKTFYKYNTKTGELSPGIDQPENISIGSSSFVPIWDNNVILKTYYSIYTLDSDKNWIEHSIPEGLRYSSNHIFKDKYIIALIGPNGSLNITSDFDTWDDSFKFSDENYDKVYTDNDVFVLYGKSGLKFTSDF